MTEQGVVVAIGDGKATVEITRTKACEHCNACGMGTRDKIQILVDNNLNARVEDFVAVSMQFTSVLRAGLFAYAIPLALLIAGVFLGMATGALLGMDPQLFGAICGLTLTALGFVALKFLEPRFKKNGKYVPVMISVVHK